MRYGRSARPAGRGGRALLAAVNVVAVVAALGVLARTEDRSSDRYYYLADEPDVLRGPYGQVDNVFAYDSEGRPLYGVSLYDSQGNSLADMVCGKRCGYPAPRGGQRSRYPWSCRATAWRSR